METLVTCCLWRSRPADDFKCSRSTRLSHYFTISDMLNMLRNLCRGMIAHFVIFHAASLRLVFVCLSNFLSFVRP